MYGILRQQEAACCLDGDGHVLNSLLALQGQEKPYRALHHRSINTAHWVVRVSVILVALIQADWHLRPELQLLLGLPGALSVRLADDLQKVLMLLLHFIIVQLLHLSVHQACHRWVCTQIRHLHFASIVHGHNHAADAANVSNSNLHGNHVVQSGTPMQLHLMKDHEMSTRRAHYEVVHGRGIRSLRHELVAQRCSDAVLTEALLQSNATVLLDCEERVFAYHENLLLAC
mmetsp:Transcript_72785/g.137662  ORF Transcript_72785/g.137662 Transcript_72785/m.137662 type:complete len:230 (+) Transcript_72785:1260-1949(+)